MRSREYQDDVAADVEELLANAHISVRYPATCLGYVVGRRAGTFTYYET